SSYRTLFLKARFNSEKWNIIFTEEKNKIHGPIMDFNKIFLLSSLLTLLVVILLSIIQIRRSLDPLEKLIQGTRHLANRNFNERINIKSSNEFYKLAESFNDMGEQLSKQFSALTTLTNIDQLMLSDPTSENIYLAIFKYINEIKVGKVSTITLINPDSNTTGNTYIYDNKKPSEISHERIFINEKDFKLLEQSTHSYYKINDDNHALFTPILKYDIKEAIIFSVKIDNQLSAFITLGYTNPPHLSAEDALQIKNISDRLAVAISTVARDKKLYKQSYYDNLTGLPNRQLLNSRLEQEISNCIRNGSTLAVLFLDLDRFKKVNDSLGHTIGDELLIEIANRLLKCVRDTDTVARLGGDEFTIILTGSVKNIDISNISDKIINEVSKPFYIRGNEIFTGTSIGISIYPNDGENRVELLKNADTAMYRVKELGRGKHLFFEEQMNIDEMERTSLENDMRNAFVNKEFSLFYQPIIDLESELIVAAETLIRWTHPVRGVVPTEKFISLAEETGFMEEIGDWVLKNACKQFTQWESSGFHINYLAVNVSTRQFLQDNFIEKLYSILSETGMSAEKLELEITEGLLMDERFDSNKILHTLKDKNIKLSIDDFGTGFSSLSYLKRFPLNTLKIDRSFLQDVPHDSDACSIVESIITLGHTLKLKVIAEGIENIQQLEVLKNFNCDFAQGYYFKRPVPADEFAELINRQNNVVKIKF
ncbi:MAG: EAL domain-containing protein, partial [Gammaproteobacteria bacterium]|nr:EAL domain-containing protein [Gammaproteobacteria bacterium]